MDNLVQAEDRRTAGEAEGALGTFLGGRLKRTKNQLQYLQNCYHFPYNSLQPVLCAKIQVFLENFFQVLHPTPGIFGSP